MCTRHCHISGGPAAHEQSRERVSAHCGSALDGHVVGVGAGVRGRRHEKGSAPQFEEHGAVQAVYVGWLVGGLADLTVEHQKAVRETDTADPDPCLVSQQLARFRLRCRVLFSEGQVYVIQETLTSNILRFYKDPSAVFVGKEALLFAMPQERAAYFEPLERIRAIVGNVLACLEAALPSNVGSLPLFTPYLVKLAGGGLEGRLGPRCGSAVSLGGVAA